MGSRPEGSENRGGRTEASRREVRDREPESRRLLRKGEGHRAGCWPGINKSNRDNDREVEHERRQGHME